MMTHKERVLERERQRGRAAAQEVQIKAPEMTGTELYSVSDRIPSFKAACAKMNMLDRPRGFVCRSSAGRVVRLLQNYNSDTYPQEPEELSAQWGFVWSTDPAKALPFVALATSPYNAGDCCTHEGHVWRSGQNGNVWVPGTTGVKWEDLGPIGAVQE